MPRRLLLVNPNTSAPVTARLAQHVQAALRDEDVTVQACTARFGAEYISSEASYAVAAHATLDAYAAAVGIDGRPDAVLVGCFGDPGVFALRELCPHPVTGLAEAAMREAAALGRFAIVTGGAAWAPMLRRLAYGLGLHEALAGVHTVAASGLQLSSDLDAARAALRPACLAAAQGEGVRSVIVGGAGLAGLAARLAGDVPVPLIDSVEAGARQALRTAPAAVAASAVRWQGLSAPLQQLLLG